MRVWFARSDRRGWLALWLVGLILAVCAAPCSGVAAPTLRPVASAPADPCQGRNLGTSAACIQIACQAIANLPARPEPPLPAVADAAYVAWSDLPVGRGDPPPDPPPRAQ